MSQAFSCSGGFPTGADGGQLQDPGQVYNAQFNVPTYDAGVYGYETQWTTYEQVPSAWQYGDVGQFLAPEHQSAVGDANLAYNCGYFPGEGCRDGSSWHVADAVAGYSNAYSSGISDQQSCGGAGSYSGVALETHSYAVAAQSSVPSIPQASYPAINQASYHGFGSQHAYRGDGESFDHQAMNPPPHAGSASSDLQVMGHQPDAMHWPPSIRISRNHDPSDLPECLGAHREFYQDPPPTGLMLMQRQTAPGQFNCEPQRQMEWMRQRHGQQSELGPTSLAFNMSLAGAANIQNEGAALAMQELEAQLVAQANAAAQAAAAKKQQAEARAAAEAAEAAAEEAARAQERFQWLLREAQQPLPSPFLTARELAMRPEALLELLPCNTAIGPYTSELVYLYTHFMLLRYDTFSDLHVKVHTLRTALRYIPKIVQDDPHMADEAKEQLMEDVYVLGKTKTASLLKTAKGFFFGVRIIGIIFEKPPPVEKQPRNQRQQPRPAPALLVEWDVVKTAENRRSVCALGKKPATHGAQMRAMTEHQIERMDMVVISTAEDCFTSLVFYATVVEVLDQYGESVLKQHEGSNARPRRCSGPGGANDRHGRSHEVPRPCRLLLEFVPLRAMGNICDLAVHGCEFVVVHFPVLLLSVLPMLENIQDLHADVLKRASGRGVYERGKRGKGKWRKGEKSGKSDFPIADIDLPAQSQELHYSELLVKLRPPPQHQLGGAPIPGKIAALSAITEEELEDFMEKNSVDASQSEAIRMCFKSPFSLIQGPPGTGKTHVARLIVKFIVERLRKQWQKVAQQAEAELDLEGRESVRVLAMAYKNMSLDNLCRGCIPFLPKGRADILRLGSKSNSTESPFTSQTEARQMYSHLPEFGGFRVGECVRLMEACQADLDKLLENIHNASMHESNGHVLCWEAFVEGATEAQRHSLRVAGWSCDLKLVVYDEWLRPGCEEVLPESATHGANLHQLLDGVLARIGMSLKGTEGIGLGGRVEFDQVEDEHEEHDEEEDFDIDEEDERMQIRRELIGRMQQRGLARGAPQDAIIRMGVLKRRGEHENDWALHNTHDLFALSIPDRHRLASAWHHEYLDRQVSQLSTLLDSYESAQKSMLSSIAERTAWLASKFMVTALTVTRSAMDRELLAHIRPHIIIVEEAAEILEANMVGGLLIGHVTATEIDDGVNGGLPSEPKRWKGDEKGFWQGEGKGRKGDAIRWNSSDAGRSQLRSAIAKPQVILIGDHKQLQPAVQSEELELQFRFGLSMFERLASNGLAVATLQHQRRMHENLTPLHDWIYAAEGVRILNAVESSRPIITCGGSQHFELPGLRLLPCDDEWSKLWQQWRSDVDNWKFQSEESEYKEKSRRRRRFSRPEEPPAPEPPAPEPLPSSFANARGARCLFLAHSSEEDVEGLSPRNEDEATIVCALVHYFVQIAGVKVENITVLTPYKGQLYMLRQMIRALQLKDPEKELLEEHDNRETQKPKFVDVQTVDTFQGEENDIIILSLTRGRRITRFLRTQNRLCVSVSRARCGFVLVGNPALVSEMEDWKQVLKGMEVASYTGESKEVETCVRPAVHYDTLRASTLYLVCPNHSYPEYPSSESCMTLARYTKTLYPEEQRHMWSTIGGQNQWTGSWQFAGSNIFQCREKCRFRCHLHGGCRKLCHDHAVCQTLVNMTLPCGHTGCYPCYTDVQTASCEKWVKATRKSCGHEIQVRCCADPDAVRCNTLVSVVRPSCRHKVIIECTVAVELGFTLSDMTLVPPEEACDADVVRAIPLPECSEIVCVPRPGCGHPTMLHCGDLRHLRMKHARSGMLPPATAHPVEELPLGPCPWALKVKRPVCGHEAFVQCHVWEKCISSNRSSRLLNSVPELVNPAEEPPGQIISAFPLPRCPATCGNLCPRILHHCQARCHVGTPCNPCIVRIRKVCEDCGSAAEKETPCADLPLQCESQREIAHPKCDENPPHTLTLPCYLSKDRKHLSELGLCSSVGMLCLPCRHDSELPCHDLVPIKQGKKKHICNVFIREVHPLCSRGHERQRKCGSTFTEVPSTSNDEPCRILVRQELPCVHGSAEVECHLANDSYRCQVRIDVDHPTCSRGHRFTIACGDKFSAPELMQPCSVKQKICLPCGHDFEFSCNEYPPDAAISCKKVVTFKHPTCRRGHQLTTVCSSRQDIGTGTISSSPCQVLTHAYLPCGHQAELPCAKVDAEGFAYTGEGVHLPKCYEILEKYRRDCGHLVARPCFEWERDPYGNNLPACEFMHQLPVTLACGHALEMSCTIYKQRAPTGPLPVDFCRPCTREVDFPLPCGHAARLPCHQVINSRGRESFLAEHLMTLCTQPISKLLPCGHRVPIACNKAHQTFHECTATVSIVLPCGHGSEIPCCQRGDVDILAARAASCTAVVNHMFRCGHKVGVPCWKAQDAGHPDFEQCATCRAGKLGQAPAQSSADMDAPMPPEPRWVARQSTRAQAGTSGQTFGSPEVCLPCGFTSPQVHLPCGHVAKGSGTDAQGSGLCNVLSEVPRPDCGHLMSLPCHLARSADVQNTASRLFFPPCKELVERERACGHLAKFVCHCWDEEARKHPCTERVAGQLICGHDAVLPCHLWADKEALAKQKCHVKLQRQLSCGHSVEYRCCDECPTTCSEIVEKKLRCGHSKMLKCEVAPDSVVCDAWTELAHPRCGHKVKLQCGSDPNHASCEQAVLAARATCGHPVLVSCSLLHSQNTGLQPWTSTDLSAEVIAGTAMVSSLPLPPCEHLVSRPHPICHCEVQAACGASTPEQGLRLEEVALCRSCQKCTTGFVPSLKAHLRARTKPMDIMLLESDSTRQVAVGALLEIMNYHFNIRARDYPGGAEAWGGLFSYASGTNSVVNMESAMHGRAADGRTRRGGGHRLQQQFIEHRLALPFDLMAMSPAPFLAPVPSDNYLRQLFLHGFPEPSMEAEEAPVHRKGRWKGKRHAEPVAPPVVVRLSLTEPEAFLRRVHNRRLAILGLYLPPTPQQDLPPGDLALFVTAEIERSRAYLQGMRTLEVVSPRQLLPMFVLEI